MGYVTLKNREKFSMSVSMVLTSHRKFYGSVTIFTIFLFEIASKYTFFEKCT